MTWRQGTMSLAGLLSAVLLCGCLRSTIGRGPFAPPDEDGLQLPANASRMPRPATSARMSDYGQHSAPLAAVAPAPRSTSRPGEESAEADATPTNSGSGGLAATVPRSDASSSAPRPLAPLGSTPFPLPEPAPAPSPVLTAPPVSASPPRAHPPRPEHPLVVALRSVLEKRSPAEVERLLQDYEPAQRQMLLDLLHDADALSGRKLDRIAPAEMAVLVKQLDHLSMVLRPRASLVIDNMCFCRSITNFGQYEPLPPEYRGFQAGRDRWLGEEVKIYLEVRNFANHRDGDYYQTLLRGSLEIWDKDDKPVVPCKELKGEPCRSRTPRQDCFIYLWFRVPPGLAPGTYKLWVQIEDVTPAPERGDRPPRVARRALDFQVIGPGLPRRALRHGEGMMTR